MFDIIDNPMPPEIDSSIQLLLLQIFLDELKGKIFFCTIPRFYVNLLLSCLELEI